MPILHSVFFYFKDDVSSDIINNQKHAIIESLSKIDGVSNVKAGAPVGIDRDVVDNAYGMSLHLQVADKKALEAYQADQIHQDFLKNFKEYWKGVKVFDTEID